MGDANYDDEDEDDDADGEPYSWCYSSSSSSSSSDSDSDSGSGKGLSLPIIHSCWKFLVDDPGSLVALKPRGSKHQEGCASIT